MARRRNEDLALLVASLVDEVVIIGDDDELQALLEEAAAKYEGSEGEYESALERQPNRGKSAMKKNSRRNPKGRHISCGSRITAKQCRQLQHVYESARDRGFSPERAAKQAWGSLENPPDPRTMRARANRMMNGAGLGGFIGSLAGVVIGLPFGQPLLSVLLSTVGGATGARYAAQGDRKERSTVGGGVGGVFGPLGAALGGYIGGRHPDRSRNPGHGGWAVEYPDGRMDLRYFDKSMTASDVKGALLAEGYPHNIRVRRARANPGGRQQNPAVVSNARAARLARGG
jgi:hypothetical protein